MQLALYMEQKQMMRIGARSSPLSRVQVQEALSELPFFPYEMIWIETTGDLDRNTSLRTLGATNFFTKELDEMLLKREIDLAIHSAKDLPNPLPEGLKVAYFSKGVDARDALCLQEGMTLELLPKGARIATSSVRREEAVLQLKSDVRFQDVRGTIHERLALLEQKKVEGVVIAEAALIRLQLTHINRVYLPGKTAEGQGKLAVVARKKGLYLGLDPSRFVYPGDLTHCPIIETRPLKISLPELDCFSHILFTSPSAVKHWMALTKGRSIAQTVLAIGASTACVLSSFGARAVIAPFATQEGVIEQLKTLSIRALLWPRSSRSRNALVKYIEKMKIDAKIIDLYTTYPRMLEQKPVLEEYDDIFFTSPSTVEAFVQNFGTIVEEKARPIGPVTKKSIDHFSSSVLCFDVDRRSDVMTHDAKTSYQLPELPFGFDALEPVISAEIMQVHYEKHHKAYVSNLNAALEKYHEAEEKNDVASMIALQQAIKFNGGGHINHSIFWTILSPVGKGGVPSDDLLAMITRDFKSLDQFKEKFAAAAVGIHGSGWAWLGYSKALKRLELASCANQDPLSTQGLVPIMGVDVWEHAYYLQYKNMRADYVKAMWQIYNWAAISSRFAKAIT